jgi:orotidine-5'-phosphate decarboxylase
MTKHAADTLQASIDKTKSIAVVGLDPRPALLPPAVVSEALATFGDTAEGVAHAFARFNRGLIKACAGHCAAVKPQLACYEAYGAPGLRAFEDTVRAAREAGIPVIADGKRNDIGSTAEHYAQAFFGGAPGLAGKPFTSTVRSDWVTVNGYLGSDGVAPFLGKAPTGTGVFVLVRTSNPSSAELQDQALAGGGTVMEAMARLVAGWGKDRIGRSGLNDVGAVVGATWPAQAKALRDLMPDTIFLVPGYGAQGGSAADALAGRRSDGRGIVVNSSRGIIAAWQKADPARWEDAARAALDAMNADLAKA